MGQRQTVNKGIRPAAITSVTPESVVSTATVPIGNYKGNAAFFDLDKLVNQPLVAAERAHIKGILDGREEDYDLQTVSIAAAEAVGTSHVGQITVPAAAVWFVSAIVCTLPGSGGANIVTGNWYCNLWTDRVGSLGYGQAYHGANFDFGAAGGVQNDEFGWVSPLWAITNKAEPLRLPGGTVLTFIATNTNAVAAGAVNATIQVYGYVGEKLVA